MDNKEQIKVAENLLRFTQDYIAVKKLLKTVKTGKAEVQLKETAESLSEEIKKCAEVL